MWAHSLLQISEPMLQGVKVSPTTSNNIISTSYEHISQGSGDAADVATRAMSARASVPLVVAWTSLGEATSPMDLARSQAGGRTEEGNGMRGAGTRTGGSRMMAKIHLKSGGCLHLLQEMKSMRSWRPQDRLSKKRKVTKPNI